MHGWSLKISLILPASDQLQRRHASQTRRMNIIGSEQDGKFDAMRSVGWRKERSAPHKEAAHQGVTIQCSREGPHRDRTKVQATSMPASALSASPSGRGALPVMAVLDDGGAAPARDRSHDSQSRTATLWLQYLASRWGRRASLGMRV